MKKFPETVFIAIKEEGTQDEFLQAELSDEEFAEVGTRTPVGKYRLVESYGVTAQRVIDRGRK